MQWLLQYGIWMLLAVGVIFLMNRGGVACGMGNRRQTILKGSTQDGGRALDPANGHSI